MKKKLILLFSHSLTKDQVDTIKSNWGIIEIVSLPLILQEEWSNIPPEISDITKHLEGIKLWLFEIVNKNDYILIQGDFGATCYFVKWAFQNEIIPIYATTKRIHIEKELKDGSIEIQKSFKHCMFRKY